MIKPGQIYRTNSKMGTRLHCITTKVVRGKCYTITHEGRGYLRWAEDFENKKLIAEYSTWQEAVNSPEFKGEKHD